jgi:hypothetical protein
MRASSCDRLTVSIGVIKLSISFWIFCASFEGCGSSTTMPWCEAIWRVAVTVLRVL